MAIVNFKFKNDISWYNIMSDNGIVYLVYVICESTTSAVCMSLEKAQSIAKHICQKSGYEYGCDVLIAKVPVDQEFDLDTVKIVLDGS
jgi:endoglucanase Acf2